MANDPDAHCRDNGQDTCGMVLEAFIDGTTDDGVAWWEQLYRCENCGREHRDGNRHGEEGQVHGEH